MEGISCTSPEELETTGQPGEEHVTTPVELWATGLVSFCSRGREAPTLCVLSP